jgi:hypothetical protein
MKVRRMKRARDRQMRRAWVAEWLVRRLAARDNAAPIYTSMLELIQTSRTAGATARITLQARERVTDE